MIQLIRHHIDFISHTNTIRAVIVIVIEYFPLEHRTSDDAMPLLLNVEKNRTDESQGESFYWEIILNIGNSIHQNRSCHWITGFRAGYPLL